MWCVVVWCRFPVRCALSSALIYIRGLEGVNERGKRVLFTRRSIGCVGACMHVCIDYGGMFLSLTKAQVDGCKVRKP